MLERVLEPEVMDTLQDAQEYDQMDHGKVNQAFVRDLLILTPPPGVWLDLGTGPAHIPILLARELANIEIVAADLAESMLDVAEHNVREAGLAERIHVVTQDAKAPSFVDGAFACVFSNSLVHHLPDAGEFWASCRRLVEPGGLLFVRDLARPRDQGTLDALVTTYAGDCTDYQRQLFAESLAAALTPEEVLAGAETAGLTGAAVVLNSDRHWTLTWRAS